VFAPDKEATMANPFKRNQPVSYEIHGRTGKVTKGAGRFKVTGERGRCTIKAEDGKDVSVFIKHVQPLVDEAPPPPAPSRRAVHTAHKTSRQTATKPARRSAGRRPAADPSGRGPRASFGQQLATIHEKLDTIMDHMANGGKPAQPKSAQPEAASAPDGHHAE
jgi:hypothetical protein